ncbi:TRAP transporter permease [Chloroflexota bacterium]
MTESEPSQYRQFKGVTARAITALAVTFSLYHVLFISGLLSRMGINPHAPQHMAVHIGVILVLVFWLIPVGKGTSRQKLPWYDILLALIGFGWNAYIIINFDDLYVRCNAALPLTIPELVVCWAFFLVVFEAARRTVGLPIALIAAVFLVYPLVASYLPGMLTGPNFSVFKVARGVGLFVTGMYGTILHISATIVFAFILFGQFLNVSGAGQWFIDISQALLGHVRGGPAKVAVLASSLMGTIQGTAVGNVATTGVFTIPLMKTMGYKPHLAGAVEAVASNGGQIMPPVMGIAAFIMMDFLGVGYDVIVVAAILPAIVYYIAVFFAVDFEAAKAGLAGLPRSELPPIRKTLIAGWQFLLPLAVLLYFLIYLQYSPQLSALYATAALIVASFFRKGNRVTPQKFFLALRNTATAMMMIAVICALAGIIVGVVQLTGLSYRLSFLLVQFAGGNLGLLLVLAAILSIILGMGMPTGTTYILLATLIAPALVKTGMLPIVAHFFVFYFGVAALITPPVCPASFVAAGIANAPPMKTAFSAARLGIATFVVPFIFAYKPALLMQGSVASILLVSVSTLIAVMALAAGLGGYLVKPINYWWRIPLIVGAILIIPPNMIFTIIGIVLIAIPVLYQLALPRFFPSHPT